MKPTILFIHGMFLNARSWDNWVSYFERRGYFCLAPSWPLHDAEPSYLRENVPAGLGDLGLDALVETYARHAGALADKPIVIGHSLGGLIAQLLAARGLVEAAVPIASVAPNHMVSADWNFLKTSAKITNPFKGHEPFEMTAEIFHETFANTMTEQESDLAYHRFAIHESRKVLRDALGPMGHIDLDAPHAPLLFIAGEKDQIVPDKLNRKNAEAYKDAGSIAEFKEFSGRGHFLCGQPGWEEIAGYVANWLDHHVLAVPAHSGTSEWAEMAANPGQSWRGAEL